MSKFHKSKEEWQEQLSEEAFEVTQNKGTEAPYSGEYDDFFEDGHYYCVCCGARLFESEDKFNAGCGWPSFARSAEGEALEEHEDTSIPDRPRTEVTCHNCDAHLGHVFEDGPPPSGRRYCINSVAITFEKK